ncbi:hypothetical protein BDAP_002486 [Binucleata daphniae]
MRFNYVAKKCYYAEQKLEFVKRGLSKLQNTFIEELEKKINIKHYLDFDVLQMHKPQNILNIFALSSEFGEKIKYLTDFKEQYVHAQTSSIKKKLETIIENQIYTKLIEKAYKRITLGKVKQSYIDAINIIKNPLCNSANPIESTENEQICSVITVNLIDDVCKHIIKIMKEQQKYNIDFERQIELFKTKTDQMINEIISHKFDVKISRIMELQNQITSDLQNTGQYKLLDMANLTNNTTFNNILNLAYRSKMIAKGKNKDVEETTTPNDLVFLSALGYINQRKEQQKEYNLKYISIINNIIELKRMIIEAEQDAFKLIENINKYNIDDDDEPIFKRRKIQ